MAPKLTELFDEFEQNLDDYDPFVEDVVEHHEESVAFQKSFCQKAIDLINIVHKRGNPFEIEHPDLIKLDNHDAFNLSVAEIIQTIEQKGKEQYDLYVSEVLRTGTKSINDPIKCNNHHLISTPKLG